LVLGDVCVVGQLRHGVQRVFAGVVNGTSIFSGAERVGHHDAERTVLGEVLAKSCAASETLRTAESCRRVATCETAWFAAEHREAVAADHR
jgi:hypothetical protein